MKLAIYSGLFGVLVSICGFSALHHWQAWALILTFSFACVWPPQRKPK